METYHIEWSHTPEECRRLLDHMNVRSSHMLDNFYWSCESGLHVGWGFIEAGSEEELRGMLPDSMHSNMKYHKVRRFSDLATGMDMDRDLRGRPETLGESGLYRDEPGRKDLDKDIDRDKEGPEIHNYEDFRPKKSA